MLFDEHDVSYMREIAASVTGIQLPFPVHAAEGDGLSVDWNGGDASVTAEDKTALCRGLFLLSKAVKENKTALHISEKRHFAHCGAMLDMSRNRVMTVEAVKRWIKSQAALGLNLLMLYTEDTYDPYGYGFPAAGASL